MKFIKKGIAIVVCLFLSFLILNAVFPFRKEIPYSTMVLSREGDLLQAFLSADDKWRMKCEPADIPEELRKGFIYKEDQYFYYHPGINPFSMLRAAVNNIIFQKRTSGASTITMQVVRLMEPRPRTIASKLIESFRALQLEWKYSKDEILGLYFDLIPYGSNVEGVQAASYIYFGQKVLKLSDAQIAALIVIPNKPTSLKPGKNNEELFRQRNKWLVRFCNNGLLTELRKNDAVSEPLIMKRHSLPSAAPHLTTMLHLSEPNAPVIRTTVSSYIQNQAEQITYNHSQRLHSFNIYNASVIVINNKSHEIVAYVGNSDFNDHDHNGQVNGVTAVRSPGSALKPLIYALGMDKGLITAKSVLNDVPVNFDGYSPENYHHDYNGQVTVEKALSYSLNIPAVELLNETGVEAFTGSLKKAGFRTIAKQEKQLGLSTVLGGCGVTLQELAGLYSSFANNGIYIKPEIRFNHANTDSVNVVSKFAAYMITGILTQLQRPDLPNNAFSSYSVPKIAWKTGTSYGRRDAWSIGYNKNYTIAVWCGNFNGTGIPELSGAETATPLLFELFNAIDRKSGGDWFRPPAGLDVRYVCSVSGKIPGEYCSDRVMDNFIPLVSSQEKCTHLSEIPVDAREKVSYCTSCCPETGFKKNIYRIYPPDVISYYQSAGIPYEKIPEHNPECQRLLNESNLTITLPVNKKEYLLEKGVEEKLMLSTSSAADASWLYWYINDAFYKKVKVHEELFFTPVTGRNKITCADDKGRSHTVMITAKFY